MDYATAMALVERLCLHFEGMYLRPYLCPAGVWTIGVGSTRYLDGTAVGPHDPAITREHALVLLRERVKREFMPAVMSLCRVTSAAQLAAITDFAYNLGVGALRQSTLRKRINAGDWAAVPYELRKWVKAGGKTLTGLQRRREAEIALL